MSRRGHHGGSDKKKQREYIRAQKRDSEERASRERRRFREQQRLREVGAVE